MKLEQIATINAGYPFRGKIPESKGSGVLAVQMRDVSLTDGIRWSSCFETQLTGKRDPGYLNTGDILIAARGSNNYAVAVDAALAPTGKQAVAAPHFFVLRLKGNTVLPEYLAWLLNQAPAQRYFEQNAEGTLTKSIRSSVLKETLIAVPPLSKQKTIIAMADALAAEHRLMQQLISNGERMMGAIAKDLYQAHATE